MDPDELGRVDPTEPFSEPVQNDPTQAVEDAEPYFAPTDPVTHTTRDGRVEVLSGFDTGQVPEAQVTDAMLGETPLLDETLTHAVRNELRHDASTTHLEIAVDVIDAVARLRGKIQDEADAENAIAVAGRVPGIEDVIDELTRS